jgi:lipopolysaccharide transport system permease protein
MQKTLVHPSSHKPIKETAVPAGKVIIEPPRGLPRIDWRELVAYRDLFYFMVRRDVQVLYRQTVLGLAWAFLRPFISMILFTFIFGRVARVSSDGIPYPLFSYAALVPWTYFATVMQTATMSLVSNSSMLTKVYFPRLVFPLTPVFSKLIDFLIALLFLPVFMVIYRVPPTPYVFFLPVLIVLMAATAAGIGMWLAALAVQYRDINHASQFLAQILMFAAPVVWPVSLLTSRFGEGVRLLYGLYPMVGVIEGFRAALLGTVPMPWDLIGLGALSATVLLFTGAYYFRHMERRFADVA